MEVTNVTARWTRRLPREPYGYAEAELVAQAVLTEGESLEEVTESLLGTLRAAVSVKLGIGIDPAASETGATVESPPCSPTTAPAAVEAPATGHPGQDSEAAEADESSGATPDEGKVITSEPSLVEPTGWTPSDLHSWMMGLVKDGAISAPPLMKVLKETGGVIRTKDLPQGKVEAVKYEIEKLMVRDVKPDG